MAKLPNCQSAPGFEAHFEAQFATELAILIGAASDTAIAIEHMHIEGYRSNRSNSIGGTAAAMAIAIITKRSQQLQ